MEKQIVNEINAEAVKADIEKFKQLDYDIYFEYSLNFGQAKLSQNHFALLTKNPTHLILIDDKEKSQKLFQEFLQFVKSAERETKSPRGVKTGIITKFKRKFKYLLIKKPSAEQTCDYLKEVFSEEYKIK